MFEVAEVSEITFPCPIEIVDGKLIVEWVSGKQELSLAGFIMAHLEWQDADSIEHLINLYYEGYHDTITCMFSLPKRDNHQVHGLQLAIDDIPFRQVKLIDSAGNTHAIALEEMPDFSKGDVLVINEKWNLKVLVLRDLYWKDLVPFMVNGEFTRDSQKQMFESGMFGSTSSSTITVTPSQTFAETEIQ
ncbi:hypothetical protein CZP2022_29 [Vibrio phage C-ZP2022]|nr:hypothetical protein CZP2022_29 [Vibrio phage C-ZP2022]